MTKKEMQFYIMADRIMNGYKAKRSIKEIISSLIRPNYTMKFLIALRKVEYYQSKKNIWKTIWGIRFNRYSYKTGFSIAPGVLGYGVVIPHFGTIVVGTGNTIGNYTVLHTTVCITGGNKIIGDALYCGTGAKILNNIELGSNVTVGANAVVNKSFKSNGILLTGIPATIKKEERPWYIRDGEIFRKRVEMCEKLKSDMGL